MSNIGLHIDGSSMHLALVKKHKSRIAIQSLKSTDTLLSEPFMEKKIEMTTGLSCRDTLIRTIEIPLIKRKAVFAALPFQIEHQVPYPINDLIIHTTLFPLDKSATQVQIIACPKTKIESHIKLLQDRGLNSNWVSSNALALWRYCHYFYPDLANVLVVYFGNNETSIVSIVDHKLHTSTSIGLGYSQFIDAWHAQNQGRTFPKQHAQIFDDKNPDLNKLKKRYFKELDRCLHFVKNRCKTALHMNGLSLGYFDAFFGTDAIIENPVENRCDLDKAPYAIAIGLALDTLLQDQQTVQMRQGKFTPSAHLGKLGKKLCYCFLLSSILAFFSLFFTNALLHQKEMQIERDLNAFLQGWNQAGKLSLTGFTLAHEKKPHKRIEYKLDRLKHLLSAQKGYFPVFTSTPLVSEFLASLTSAPLFKKCDIQSFDYELLQYPTLSHPFVPYQGIVRLYMKISDPSIAKQIQEYLENDCFLVDSSHPVQWERLDDGYKAEFYMHKVRK